jgi:glycosyltransferase involved in cell wall biosynthesis
MNMDSVVRLVNAVGTMEQPPLIELCTASNLPSAFQRDYVKKSFYDRPSLMNAQRSSSILYLPQAFESDLKLMIKNNFPTKAVEYLCSGRPILVHSPADSYLSHIARQEGYALVVDKPDQNALRDAVSRLLEDTDLQHQLVDNAIAYAKSISSRRWSKKLQEHLFHA